MVEEPHESQPIWDVLGAITGFLAAVAIAITIVDIGPPTPIASSMTGPDSNMIRVDAYVLALGWALFIWFSGALKLRLQERERPSARLSSVAFAGAIALAVMGLGSAGFKASAVLAVDDGGSGALLETLSDTWIGLASLPAAVMLGATFLVSIRYRALPAVLSWSAGLIAIAVFVIGALGFIGSYAVTPGGTLGMAAIWGSLAWMAATSLTLALDARASANPQRK